MHTHTCIHTCNPASISGLCEHAVQGQACAQGQAALWQGRWTERLPSQDQQVVRGSRALLALMSTAQRPKVSPAKSWLSFCVVLHSKIAQRGAARQPSPLASPHCTRPLAFRACTSADPLSKACSKQPGCAPQPGNCSACCRAAPGCKREPWAALPLRVSSQRDSKGHGGLRG